MVRGRARAFGNGSLRLVGRRGGVEVGRPLAATLMASLVLGVVLVGAGPASADTALFSDGFESGNFSAWTQVFTGGGGTASVQSTTVSTGSFAAQLSESAAAGSAAYARKTLSAAQTDVTVSGDFRVTQEGASGGNVPLFRLLDPASVRIVSVYRQNATNGMIGIGYGGGHFSSTGSLPLNTWGSVSVHVVIAGATSTVEVRLNGTLVYQATNASLGTAGVATIQIGNDTAAQAFALVADTINVNAGAGAATAANRTREHVPADHRRHRPGGPDPDRQPRRLERHRAHHLLLPLAALRRDRRQLRVDRRRHHHLPADQRGRDPHPARGGHRHQRRGPGRHRHLGAQRGGAERIHRTREHVPASGGGGQTRRPSGTAQVGQTLTANPGTWTGTAPITYSYLWQRCDGTGANCASTGVATATYPLSSADATRTLRVVVTATNGVAPDGAATSAPSAVVQSASAAPVNTSPPTIGGTAQVGQTLTANPGAWSGTAPITYSYLWQRCDGTGANCASTGVATTTYPLTSADATHTLRVLVTATNGVAPDGTATSAPSAVVQTASAAPVNTSPPTISGTAQVGQTLTANPGTWTGTAPITYSYLWQRCDAAGANCASTGVATTTYPLTSADATRTLRVVVTATNGVAPDGTATSAPSAVVQNASTAGLAALWHMDETSGTVMHDAVGSHTGTLHSVALGQSGYLGTAFGFNGSSSYVSVPSSSDLNPGSANITITIHLKTTSTGDARLGPDPQGHVHDQRRRVQDGVPALGAGIVRLQGLIELQRADRRPR